MEQWQRLHCSSDELPPVHVKATFSNDGYTVRLTDLSRIWGESLKKSDILERARRRNCSIDPSEDDEQYHILLAKVKSAVSQSNDTTAALSSTKDGKLKLHLEAPLSKPLPTFEWEISLEPSPDDSIGDELVTPLLSQIDNLNRQRQSLLAEIQAKDKIVYKLTDRLETSGHNIKDIFPGAAKAKVARGRPQREELARHVRGLGAFNEDAWAAQFEAKPNAVNVSSQSTDAILASLPARNVDVHRPRAAGDWWKNIPADQQIELGDTAAGEEDAIGNGDLPSKANAHETSEVIEDDDFQRQATPPRLRGHSPPVDGQGDVNMREADGDSTEDEDDLDGPSQKAPNPVSRPAESTNRDKTPTVESEKASPSPKRNPQPQAATGRSPFAHDDEDTEDEDDDDLDGPSQPSQKRPSSSQLPSRHKSQTTQPTAAAASPPRKRLGTLGGRARTRSPAVSHSPPPNSEPREPTPIIPSPNPRPKPKLGTIGGSKAKPRPPSPISNSPPPAKKLGTIGGRRATAEPSTAAAALPPPSDRATTASATPEPPKQSKEPGESRREEPSAESVEPVSVEERANAKRDALKRELEAKAKAPAKKKRKF